MTEDIIHYVDLSLVKILLKKKTRKWCVQNLTCLWVFVAFSQSCSSCWVISGVNHRKYRPYRWFDNQAMVQCLRCNIQDSPKNWNLKIIAKLRPTSSSNTIFKLVTWFRFSNNHIIVFLIRSMTNSRGVIGINHRSLITGMVMWRYMPWYTIEWHGKYFQRWNKKTRKGKGDSTLIKTAVLIVHQIHGVPHMRQKCWSSPVAPENIAKYIQLNHC